jgi:hypothetical protein
MNCFIIEKNKYDIILYILINILNKMNGQT